jgi:hypothetical protein
MNTFNRIIQYEINDSGKIFNCENKKKDIDQFVDTWHDIHENELNVKNIMTTLVKSLIYTYITSFQTFTLKTKYKLLNDIQTNMFLSNESKEQFFDIFSKTQRTYLALCKFAYVCKFKRAKIQIDNDMYLNPIEVTDQYTITILQNNKKYLFTYTDLINIIHTAIGHSDYFFANPLEVKNPYNNIPFNYATLCNIYFFVRSVKPIVPELFHHFFLCNFDLDWFQFENEALIREYTIKSYLKNASAQTISSNIRNMLKSNILCKRLVIHKAFPIDILNEALKPHLYVYLLSIYSYDRNKKDHHYTILNEKLKNFYRYNKLFGRKIYKKEFSLAHFGKVVYKSYFNTSYLPFALKPLPKIEQKPLVFSDTESDEENESIYEDKSEDEREEEIPQENGNTDAREDEEVITNNDEEEDDSIYHSDEDNSDEDNSDEDNGDEDNGDEDNDDGSSVTLRTSDTMSIESR